MSNLGMGVMLARLSSNAETVEAVTSSYGKRIKAIRLNKDAEPEELLITFEDDTTLVITDNGQSCCETRYMSCDDDMQYHVGAQLVKMEIADAPNQNEPDSCGEHEVQFLKVDTTKGGFTLQTHNEHNGYYGGFAIEAKLIKPEPVAAEIPVKVPSSRDSMVELFKEILNSDMAQREEDEGQTSELLQKVREVVANG